MRKLYSKSKIILLIAYSPDDINLVREVGKALIMTHDYNRAIKYYETTLHEDPKLVLFHYANHIIVGLKD